MKDILQIGGLYESKLTLRMYHIQNLSQKVKYDHIKDFNYFIGTLLEVIYYPDKSIYYIFFSDNKLYVALTWAQGDNNHRDFNHWFRKL